MGIILMEKVFISHNEQETSALAAKLAQISKAGDVWALNGTLGAGKSVFARAFIRKLTAAEEVPSPTFTLAQIYHTTHFDIYHYDLYRLKSPEEIFELGVEEAFYSAVNLVEWPEKMAGFAPRDMWNVQIDIVDDVRKITVSAPTDEKNARLSNICG